MIDALKSAEGGVGVGDQSQPSTAIASPPCGNEAEVSKALLLLGDKERIVRSVAHCFRSFG